MPYQSVTEVPETVPKEHRKQWMEVFNSVYAQAKKDGKPEKECEAMAFEQANGVIKKAMHASPDPIGASDDLIYGQAILLDELPRAGADGVRELPIALVGNWVYKGKPFSLTEGDLKTIVGNFEKRKNGEINVDYDHASEDPEVARGGPIPSAGRVTRLRSDRVLHGAVEFTERAEQLIEKKEYRYFSPAIYRNYPDKQTGKDQGMTLHTVALTNTPFLEELPAIRLSEISVAAVSSPSQPNRRSETAATVGGTMPELSATKVSAGKYQIVKGTEVLGSVEIPEPVGPQPEEIIATFTEKIGAKGKTEAEVKALVETAGKFTGRETQAAAHKLLATECVKDGKLDRERMKVLARESKVGMEDFLAFEDAFTAVDEAVRAGKILPMHREFFLKIALSDVAEFKKFAEKAPKIIDLNVRGLGGEGRVRASGADSGTTVSSGKVLVNVDRVARIKAMQAESAKAGKQLGYSEARAIVLSEERAAGIDGDGQARD